MHHPLRPSLVPVGFSHILSGKCCGCLDASDCSKWQTLLKGMRPDNAFNRRDSLEVCQSAVALMQMPMMAQAAPVFMPHAVQLVACRFPIHVQLFMLLHVWTCILHWATLFATFIGLEGRQDSSCMQGDGQEDHSRLCNPHEQGTAAASSLEIGQIARGNV